MQGNSPQIPQLPAALAWGDLALAEEHVRAIRGIAESPQELSGLTVATLREKGLEPTLIRALLRAIVRLAPADSSVSAASAAPALCPPLLSASAQGVRWADLHLHPVTFRVATRLAESPVAVVGRPVEELRRVGFLPRHLQEIFQAVSAYTRTRTCAVLPGSTAYREELVDWVGSHGPLPEALARKTLPEIPQVRPAPVRLSYETDLFLTGLEADYSAGVCGPFRQMTVSDLLERGANPSMVLELADLSEAAGQARWAAEGMNDHSALKAAAAVCAAADNSQISADDPRMGPLIRHLAGEAANATEAAQTILDLKIAGVSPLPARALLVVTLEQKISLARKMKLESELADISRAITTVRNISRILEHFGWSGRAPVPNARVAERAGISKERVRSMCAPFKDLGGAAVFAPALDQATALLGTLTGKTAEEAAEALAAAHISAAPFHPAGVFTAARIFGRKTGVAVAESGGIECILPAGYRLPRGVLARARQRAVNRGALRISEIVPDRADELLSATLRRELTADPNFRWLDQQAGWFALLRYSWQSNRLLTCLEKMLSIAPRLRITDIESGWARYSKGAPRLPAPVLERLCELLPGVQVGPGRRVAIERPPRPEDVLSGAELECVRLMKLRGDTESVVSVINAWPNTGFSRSTLSAVLAWSPVVIRHGLDRYSLLGGIESRAPSRQRDAKPRPNELLRATS